MGFKSNVADVPESMKPLVEEAIERGGELLEPLACYDFRPVRKIKPDRIEVSANFTIQSQKAFRWLNGCNGIYLVAVTIGPKLDQKVAELSASGEVTRAFLLNAYGSEAAEALMESLDREVSKLAGKRGLETTKRYSPGYGDWPITAQRDLLNTLEAHLIGIRLTEQFLMIPEKSVSAIIGTCSRHEKREP